MAPFWKKDWSQLIGHMQIPIGRDQPEEWACPVGMLHPSQMFYWNPSPFGQRSPSVIRIWFHVKSNRWMIMMSLYVVRLQNVIQYSWEGNFILFDEISVSNIEIPQWKFHTFFCSRNFLESRIVLRINHSYEEQSRVLSGLRWNNATKERKVCGMLIEIVMFA